MPFYVADYLADTMHLTTSEHGAYLLIILHYWKSGPIPDDDSRLATISRLGDAWSNASSSIRAFFEQRDGMLYHKRIDHEKAEAIGNQDRNHARAKAAANKRWGKNATSNACSNAPNVPGDCPSPSPSPIVKTKSKAESAIATRLPADWTPSTEDYNFCKVERPDLVADDVAAAFRDYWAGVPGAKGRKADWPATWRNWVRKEVSRSGPRRLPPPDNFGSIDYGKSGRL